MCLHDLEFLLLFHKIYKTDYETMKALNQAWHLYIWCSVSRLFIKGTWVITTAFLWFSICNSQWYFNGKHVHLWKLQSKVDTTRSFLWLWWNVNWIMPWCQSFLCRSCDGTFLKFCNVTSLKSRNFMFKHTHDCSLVLFPFYFRDGR